MFIKRNLSIINLEFKLMGKLLYVPIAMFGVILIYTYGLSILSGNLTSINILEVSISLLASWWIIFSVGEIYETEGSEIFNSYVISRFKLGNIKVIYFSIIYILFSSIIVILGTINYDIYEIIVTVIQIALQSIFFIMLAYCTIVLIRKSEWCLFVVGAYSSIQIITRGELIPIVNIYLFNSSPVVTVELINLFVKIATYSIIFMAIIRKNSRLA